MRTSIFALALVLFALPATLLAAFLESQWKYIRPIVLGPERADGTYVSVDVDRTVSASSLPDLSDLRIIAGDGSETPYQLVIEAESLRNEFFPSAITDLSSRDGKVMFVLDLGSDVRVHDHLRIFTSSKNFKHPVAVFASDVSRTHDDQGWRLLSDNGVIYNFYDRALGFDSGKSDVFYPESTSRYLRVVIGGGEGESVAVGGASVARFLKKHARESTMRVSVEIAPNEKEKTTEITLDLGARGIPVREIELATNQTKNFNRRVTVLASNDKERWALAGSGFIFSLATPAFTGRDLSVHFPERLDRYLRVVVWDEDNQPISFAEEFTLTGIARSLVFQPEAGQNYVLYHGNASAEAPKYDLARYFAYIEGADLPQASLGDASENPNYLPPPPPVVPFTEKYKIILNGTLVVLAGVLTFLLIAHLKRLKLTKPGSGNE